MQRKINQINFNGQPIYIGIDVHQKNWKVAIMSEHYEHKVFHQDPKPEILVNYLHNHFPGAVYHAAYEAGFSGFTLYRELTAAGVNCMVAHPADVPTTHKEYDQKCDKRDSRKLAKSLRGNMLQAIYVPSDEQLADRSLVRLRASLVKDLTRIKLRLKSLLMFHGVLMPASLPVQASRRWSKSYVSWVGSLQVDAPGLKATMAGLVSTGQLLNEQVLAVTKQINALAQHPSYSEQVKLLIGIPGIGRVTAMSLLTELGDTSRFKRLDELCNYIGLVPSTRSTGDKQAVGSLTIRGRGPLKAALIESAWVAVRKDAALLAKFEQLSNRMQKNKAIIRISRKLLSRIRHVLLHRQAYVCGVVA